MSASRPPEGPPLPAWIGVGDRLIRTCTAAALLLVFLGRLTGR